MGTLVQHPFFPFGGFHYNGPHQGVPFPGLLNNWRQTGLWIGRACGMGFSVMEADKRVLEDHFLVGVFLVSHTPLSKGGQG